VGGWDERDKEDAGEEGEEDEKGEAAGLAEGEDHVEGRNCIVVTGRKSDGLDFCVKLLKDGYIDKG